MNNRLLIPIALLSLVFINCANQKHVGTQQDLEVLKAHYNKTTPGVRGGNSYLNFFIEVEHPEEVVLDSIFFHGRGDRLEKDLQRKNVYTASWIIDGLEGNGDLIMHVDPKEEFGNQAPPKLPQRELDLEEDQALLIFRKGGKSFTVLVNQVERKGNDAPKRKKP